MARSAGRQTDPLRFFGHQLEFGNQPVRSGLCFPPCRLIGGSSLGGGRPKDVYGQGDEGNENDGVDEEGLQVHSYTSGLLFYGCDSDW